VELRTPVSLPPPALPPSLNRLVAINIDSKTMFQLKKLSLIEDRFDLSRHKKVGHFELRHLNLTSDLDLQSQETYGHDPFTCQRSEVTRFKEWKQTDGGDCITSRVNAVGNKFL